MSEITTVLISATGCDEEDDRQINELNAGLRQLRELRGDPRDIPDYWALKNIAEPAAAWGGTKAPPALYGGTMNKLPFAQFVALVAGLEWPDPQAFQLMVMSDEDDRYRVLTLADLRDWAQPIS